MEHDNLSANKIDNFEQYIRGLSIGVRRKYQMLRAKYPDKVELTFNEFADYMGYTEEYALKKLRAINRDKAMLSHSHQGKNIRISFVNFAKFLVGIENENKDTIYTICIHADNKRKTEFEMELADSELDLVQQLCMISSKKREISQNPYITVEKKV